MTDHVDTPKRSSIMASVKSKDTGPEMNLRRMIHAAGYRYRLHDSRLPGKPDIVFASKRKAIFVNGCFWHRHAGCRYATTPKTRTAFWNLKFQANVNRDARNIAALQEQGWTCAIVWQCELKQPQRVLNKIIKFLENR